MEDNELYHFGTKGMRWGFRRYQNEDGSLTDEGRRHYGYGLKEKVKNIKEAHHKKVAAKKRAKALEKARKARVAKAEYEKAKKKALETGTADEVAKYITSLTEDEKKTVINRLKLDKDLNQLASDAAKVKAEEAARKSKWNKFNGISKKAGEFAGNIENWKKLYNASAEVLNTFGGTDLKKIGEKDDTPKQTETNRMADAFFAKYKNMSVKEFAAADIESMRAQSQKLSTLDAIERYTSKSQKSNKKK